MKLSVLVALASLLLTMACASPGFNDGCQAIMIGEESLSNDVLLQRVGVAEAERQNLRDGVPFGDRYAEWEEIKNEIERGDELWFYRDNRTIAGAEGYVVIRDCEVIAFFITTKY